MSHIYSGRSRNGFVTTTAMSTFFTYVDLPNETRNTSRPTEPQVVEESSAHAQGNGNQEGQRRQKRDALEDPEPNFFELDRLRRPRHRSSSQLSVGSDLSPARPSTAAPHLSRSVGYEPISMIAEDAGPCLWTETLKERDPAIAEDADPALRIKTFKTRYLAISNSLAALHYSDHASPVEDRLSQAC